MSTYYVCQWCGVVTEIYEDDEPYQEINDTCEDCDG